MSPVQYPTLPPCSCLGRSPSAVHRRQGNLLLPTDLKQLFRCWRQTKTNQTHLASRAARGLAGRLGNFARLQKLVACMCPGTGATWVVGRGPRIPTEASAPAGPPAAVAAAAALPAGRTPRAAACDSVTLSPSRARRRVPVPAADPPLHLHQIRQGEQSRPARRRGRDGSEADRAAASPSRRVVPAVPAGRSKDAFGRRVAGGAPCVAA